MHNHYKQGYVFHRLTKDYDINDILSLTFHLFFCGTETV